jgi:hypothetical protein
MYIWQGDVGSWKFEEEEEKQVGGSQVPGVYKYYNRIVKLKNSHL